MPRMSQDQIFTNAHLVLDEHVMLGTLVVGGGRIRAIDSRRSHLPAAMDCGRDWLIPGLIDLHTDNLERQCQPRTGVRWPAGSAYIAHDAQCVAAGITTVLDALCVGDIGYEPGRIETLRQGVAMAAALAPSGLLKAEHALHLRCELAAPDMQALLAEVAGAGGIQLISVMDHTPGFGQYADLERFRALRRKDPMADAEVDALIETLQGRRARFRAANRAHALDFAARRGIAVASHDDATEAEIVENHADGIAIAEFPVTRDAAAAARARGMGIIAGAPNLVRGFSHYGNIAVASLLAAGLIDALASDYVPASLLEAALPATLATADVPARIALVARHPARLAGLADRGRLAPGLRADLVRVHRHDALPPIIRAVWREGCRVG